MRILEFSDYLLIGQNGTVASEMSPDWSELVIALASTQRSLASEITCGLTEETSPKKEVAPPLC